MNGPTTRRGFLRQATAASGGLLVRGLGRAAYAADVNGPARPTVSPILVVTESLSADVNPRAPAWGYIEEILQHAGLFFERRAASQLPSLAGRAPAIVLVAGHLPLTAAERQILTEWVKGGTSLIGIGGTSGLDEAFGAATATPLAEGWLKVTAADHPVTAGLRSSLHVFGGYVARPGSATTLATVESGSQGPKGGGILENRFGKGLAVLLAPDLVFSVVHIQQGLPVLQDGDPAADDSAAVDDGVLKAEDGMVLDWQRDRQPIPPENVPAFLEPVSDELREIILRSIFHVAASQGVTLPVLWYWPRLLPAVGHLSHDSDGNDPKKATALLDVMNRLDVKSTWCVLYPGGYPKEFYGKLQDQGFEVALHYDAKTGGTDTSWSRENFLLQHRWLLREAGLRHITSNKNHYTRWEGRLDFFRWCEEAGIETDQTRGPSKRGTIGFPLGGSQPYFPWDDRADSPRRLNVLEVNLLTQDLVVTCPAEYGKQLADSVLRHHGVAHFLFHPNHILKPGVADAMAGLVAYAGQQRMPWWKSDEICRWQSLRRGVTARFTPAGGVTLRPASPLRDAALLFLKTGPQPRVVRVNGQPAAATPWTWHGFEFDAVTVDLAGEMSCSVEG